MKQVSRFLNFSPRLAPIVLLAGAACSDTTHGGGAASELAFMASTTTALSSASVAPITNGGHTLDLTQVTLTIGRAELKRVHDDACAGEDEGDDDKAGTGEVEDCPEVKVGPTAVDLPLAGGLVTLPANALPAGTFRELELRVSDVRLRGTFDTKAFDITLPVNARGEIEFATPLVVTDGTPTSITVNVPVDRWLVNADGSLIDPNTILASPTLMTLVKARIAASFHAFEDRDHDGRSWRARLIGACCRLLKSDASAIPSVTADEVVPGSGHSGCTHRKVE